MGDHMRAIPFKRLVNWILEEYAIEKSIFGIPYNKFYQSRSGAKIHLFGDVLDTPVGPAAGPNTQLAQNIAAAYLCGGRFMELKTVQILDSLRFPKPCIAAEDECYNTEWSTELSIEGACEEYVKAWFLLHLLQVELTGEANRSFMFNMSVGYDLKGIQSEKVDSFIEGLKDASSRKIFKECLDVLQEAIKENHSRFKFLDRSFVDNISPNICSSITLSTMHGCPPAEIEAICKYLLSEKKLHTFVKLNPTLLGYEYVKNTLHEMGYHYIELKEESFTHDLQYADGIAMLKRLKAHAAERDLEFGVKLSNTLPVKITRGELPGEEMYMSGRSLYPLTVSLALKLAGEFAGDLQISYSGGADYFNIVDLYQTGIQPITVATTLLKPGGYMRLKQIAEALEPHHEQGFTGIKVDKLKALAARAIADSNYRKERKVGASRKLTGKLPLLDCFTAPCTHGCPIGQDIPEYTRLVGEGRYNEAYEVIVSKNPLPFITGTICNHLCMGKCTRLDYDQSVKIRDLKKVAAEKGYQAFMDKPVIKKDLTDGARVAVIGAGPSGLAAGYFLAREGFNVTIFDKRERPGGTVEFVIPEFRIAREAIKKDVELIQKMGVKFELGVKEDLSVSSLKEKGFEYIYIAVGAQKSQPLKIDGDEHKVISAIEFLEDYNKNPDEVKPGKNVAVIGGGNTAMDAARAALRVHGVDKVYIVYRRTKDYMPADREELEAAVNEGVIFKELLSPLSLKDGALKCQKMQLTEADETGRRNVIPVEDQTEEIKIDTVLSAIGETVDYHALKRLGIEMDAAGKILVDAATNETNLEKVYIGGDVLTGPSSIVEAIAQGARAAKAITARERREDEKTEGASVNASFGEERYEHILGKKGYLRLAAEEIHKEAERCLECQHVCNVCVEVCPNRANVAVDVEGAELKDRNQVIHIDGMCNECGNCATFCPHGGAPYKDKLTLFWSEEDFKDSENNGFLLLEDGEEPVFRLRIDGKESDVKFDKDGAADAGIDPAVLALVWAVFQSHIPAEIIVKEGVKNG
ncbi:MAG: putative selenate reductase subunit YgfK [Bacillota bacterium]